MLRIEPGHEAGPSRPFGLQSHNASASGRNALRAGIARTARPSLWPCIPLLPPPTHQVALNATAQGSAKPCLHLGHTERQQQSPKQESASEVVGVRFVPSCTSECVACTASMRGGRGADLFMFIVVTSGDIKLIWMYNKSIGATPAPKPETSGGYRSGHHL